MLANQFIVMPAHAAAPATGGKLDVASQVICNVVSFVQKLGLPIMTGVILGSSVMAVFGRLAWPAIAMLIVFTAIFFGASKLIERFAGGIADIDADGFECKAASKPGAAGSGSP
ncbi:MAG: TrbC/VirB2 family protein [Aaplasma endosymbiont of Hyalomma asiaticum]